MIRKLDDIDYPLILSRCQVASFCQRKTSRNAAFNQFAVATAPQTFKVSVPMRTPCAEILRRIP